MTGAPSWEEIIWLAGLVSAVFLGAFFLAWRIAEIRTKDSERWAKDRHELRSSFEQKVVALDERFDLVERSFITRLTAIETFNAGTVVVLDHMEKFKDEVSRKLDELQKDRRESTDRILQSISSLHNTARMTQSDVEETKGARR